MLTGAAEADFQSTQGLEFDSEAQVLQAAQMVRLDWQRSVQAPGAVPCLRSYLLKTSGSHAKLVSFARIAFPHIATFAAAFRVLLDVQAQGKTVRVIVELVLVGRGRTEITLTAIAPAAAQAAVSAATLRLARILVARVRA